tara:strand:- start:413 stop:604 length:192 start_codon:yes stop_codon:yes gene_type:complete
VNSLSLRVSTIAVALEIRPLLLFAQLQGIASDAQLDVRTKQLEKQFREPALAQNQLILLSSPI